MIGLQVCIECDQGVRYLLMYMHMMCLLPLKVNRCCADCSKFEIVNDLEQNAYHSLTSIVTFIYLVCFRKITGCPVPLKDILQDLATKINHQKKCKFNINRSTVLDGAIRGFKRGTYDPYHTISVRFSNDLGVPEEAVDCKTSNGGFATISNV